MTKDYLFARRLNYYALRSNAFEDDFSSLTNIEVIVNDSTIIEDAIRYLTVYEPGVMRYPGKSYAIAYCYAYWLSELGAGDIRELLDLPDLMNYDDPYFVTYSNAVEIYEGLISKVEIPDPSNNEYLACTRRYFLEEFMLDPEGIQLSPIEFGS